MTVYINIDGAARGNPGPAGYGIAACDQEGTLLQEAYGYLGDQTNNAAEYCGLVAALELAVFNKWNDLVVRSDSQLMVRQIQGEYKVKNPALKALFMTAKSLISRLNAFEIQHVPRKENKEADKLANKAVDEENSSPHFINPVLEKPVSRGENLNLEF